MWRIQLVHRVIFVSSTLLSGGYLMSSFLCVSPNSQCALNALEMCIRDSLYALFNLFNHIERIFICVSMCNSDNLIFRVCNCLLYTSVEQSLSDVSLEKCMACLFSLCGFLLTVNKLCKLECQDFFSFIELCALPAFHLVNLLSLIHI